MAKAASQGTCCQSYGWLSLPRLCQLTPRKGCCTSKTSDFASRQAQGPTPGFLFLRHMCLLVCELDKREPTRRAIWQALYVDAVHLPKPKKGRSWRPKHEFAALHLHNATRFRISGDDLPINRCYVPQRAWPYFAKWAATCRDVLAGSREIFGSPAKPRLPAQEQWALSSLVLFRKPPTKTVVTSSQRRHPLGACEVLQAWYS